MPPEIDCLCKQSAAFRAVACGIELVARDRAIAGGCSWESASASTPGPSPPGLDRSSASRLRPQAYGLRSSPLASARCQSRRDFSPFFSELTLTELDMSLSSVRAVTATRDQHRAQGADANRTGIRNHNLADPMSPRSTYRVINGSLACQRGPTEGTLQYFTDFSFVA